MILLNDLVMALVQKCVHLPNEWQRMQLCKAALLLLLVLEDSLRMQASDSKQGGEWELWAAFRESQRKVLQTWSNYVLQQLCFGRIGARLGSAVDDVQHASQILDCQLS